MKKWIYRLFIVLPLASMVVLLFAREATYHIPPNKLTSTATFQAGHIIDDNIFTDSSSLNASQIQTFLNDMITSQGGCYAPGTKSTSPPNGACINEYCENTATLANNFSSPTGPGSCPSGEISAAQIIYNAAVQSHINPEVIITTLQKEQGLITDTWPWYIEYQEAMGFNCPDTTGCSGYADFYQQVTSAAAQYRYYLNNPGAFNYWIGANSINYSPSCTGSTVDIQNAATAALYIYTPYQPDSTVLANTNPIGSANGPGPSVSSTDSCASYGNRNFWWYFNSWFGPSIDTSVSLAEESGSGTVYVLYDGEKQGIPSQDVLNSWGLNGLPITTLDSSVFTSIPTASTVLSRYALDNTNGTTYFADNGNVYSVSSSMASAWGFSSISESQVSNTLVNFANNEGAIKPFMYVSGSGTYYLVDNGILHGFSSAALYTLWAGQNNQPIQISQAYFSTMTQSTSYVTSPEFSYNSADYLLSDGSTYTLSSDIASLLPSSWSNLTIGSGLYNSFASNGPLNYMFTAAGIPTVYILNNGYEEGMPDYQTYSYFHSSTNSALTYVSADLINYLPQGPVVSSNIVNINGSYFVVDNGLIPIPSSLTSTYTTSNSEITLSNAYQNLIPSISGTITPFIKSTSSGTIYFLDNGEKFGFSNATTYNTVAGSIATTYLTPAAISSLPNGAVMQTYITDGSKDYLIDSGNEYTVPSSSVAAAWGLTNPVSISSSGIAYFANIGNLSQNIQLPSGFFCLLDSLTTHCAYSNSIISLWNLTNGVVHPSQNLLNNQGVVSGVGLSRFVSGAIGSVSSGTIYTIANGTLYGITSMDDALNLGFTGSFIRLSQSTITSLPVNIWQGYLASDSNGAIWILDGGLRRPILSSQDVTNWVGSNTPSALGTTYISLLPLGYPIGDAIVTQTNATYYGIKSGQKEGIPSMQAYDTSGLDPVTLVSQYLEDSVPDGGIWPN